MSRSAQSDPDAVVRDVLAGAAYRHASSETARAPDPTLWQMIWNGIEHALRSFFAPLAHAFASASQKGVGRLLALAIVVAALGLVAFVIYRLALVLMRTPRGGGGVAGRSAILGSERDAGSWRTLARDYAQNGDFARAIAALFSAALAILDERAVVAFDAARTPGEYRRAVRRERAQASESFDRLAERFVHASYAREIPTAQAYADADAAFERFEPATRA